jgi:hypothetical protein
MAGLSPDRPGPICIHSRSRVPSPAGSRVKRQLAAGWAASPTAQANTCGGSHSTTDAGADHSPIAGCLLWPTNRLPTSPEPCSHSTRCSSTLIDGISSTSDTMAHTRSGGASTCVSTSTVGQSA